MKKINRLYLPLALITLLAGCGGQAESAGQMDYDQTKKMIVDILKTDEGKKAVQELLADEKIKQNLIMDEAIVADTIQTTLTSEKGTEFWKKTFADAEFAESMAKSMKAENENLLKGLMKDPEYRGMMIEVIKDPEVEKEISNVLKSKEYREHLQTVMTETFESPLFQAKIQDILLKAASKAGSSEGGGEESGGEEEQGGGNGGGSEEESQEGGG